MQDSEFLNTLARLSYLNNPLLPPVASSIPTQSPNSLEALLVPRNNAGVLSLTNPCLIDINSLTKTLKLQEDLMTLMTSNNLLPNQQLFNRLTTSTPSLINQSLIAMPRPELDLSRPHLNAMEMAIYLADQAEKAQMLKNILEPKVLYDGNGHHYIKIEEKDIHAPEPLNISENLQNNSSNRVQATNRDFHLTKKPSNISSQNLIPKRPHSEIEVDQVSARQARRSKRQQKAAEKLEQRCEQDTSISKRTTRSRTNLHTVVTTNKNQVNVKKPIITEDPPKKYLRCGGSSVTNIGEQYQSVIPACVKNPSSRRNNTPVWDPSTDCDYRRYLKKITELIGGHLKEEKALKFLKWKNYDVEEALRIIKKKKNYFRDSMTFREENIEGRTPAFK
jgi:hypothetical protein